MRKHQRGLSLVGGLIGAAVIGVALVSAKLWIDNFIDTTWVEPAEKRGEQRGIENQLAADQKVLGFVSSDRDHWKEAAGQREQEANALSEKVNGKGGLVDQLATLRARGSKATQQTAAITAAAAQKQAASAAETTRLQAIVSSTNKALGTAQEQLNRIDAENTKYLNERAGK